MKLFFSKDVTNELAKQTDEKAIKLIDANDKKVPIDIYFSNKEEGMILVAADTTANYKVLNNSEYRLVIDKSFAADDGTTLSEPVEVKFTTLNQKMMMSVNMGMMFAMMALIMFITVKQQKDSLKKTTGKEELPPQFNPYKEAKRTGKTIEEVTAEHEKKMAKLAKKKAKKAKDEPEYVKNIVCADYLNNVYKVKAPAPTRNKIAEVPEKEKKSGKKGGKKK